MGNDKEIWRSIENYCGYFVSNFGRVKSKTRFVKDKNGKNRIQKGRILKFQFINNYYSVTLCNEVGEHQIVRVHHLVLECFCSKRPSPKHQCNHKDGNKLNNNIHNLEWMTALENTRHAHRVGLANSRGIANAHSKLSEEDVLNIRDLYKKNVSMRELSKKFNVSVQNIHSVIRKKAWAHI